MAEHRWPADKNIQFIKEYRRHECLWDPKHPQYKNRHVREAAYKDIMVAMEMDNYRDVITKIRILRNTWNNEATKAKRSMATDTPYVSRISWLHHMDFCKNIDDSRESTDNAPHIPEEPVPENNTEELIMSHTPTAKGTKRKMDHRWSADENIQFINQYRKNDCLWDPKHPHYKNKQVREAAYKDIMAAMDMESVKDVITRIRTLRNTYNNQLLKEKKCIEAETQYVCRIAWLPFMDFLKNIDDTRENSEHTSNVPEETLSYSPDYKSECSTTPHSPASDTSTRKEIKKPETKDTILKTVSTAEKASQHFSNAGRNDEFGLFGQTVAQQLRQMPLEFALETEEMVLATIRRQRIRVLNMQKSESQRDPLESDRRNLNVAVERDLSSDEEVSFFKKESDCNYY